MKPHEIEEKLSDDLSPGALSWWNGASREIVDEYVILAQREGIEVARAEIEDSAK
ncbi:MAG: hypothetical protein V1755_06540 [Chloroflexota bacterium]